MGLINNRELEGKRVFTQHGREIGTVEALDVELDDWRVVSLELKLKRSVLEELNLKRPLLGSQRVRIPVEHVSGVTDTVVLKKSLQELAYVHEEAKAPPREDAGESSQGEQNPAAAKKPEAEKKPDTEKKSEAERKAGAAPSSGGASPSSASAARAPAPSRVGPPGTGAPKSGPSVGDDDKSRG